MAEKIFLLEDDAYLRDGLLEMLQGRDYEVESAESIKKAEIIIKEKRFSQTGFRPLYFSADVPLLRIRHSVAVRFLSQYAF